MTMELDARASRERDAHNQGLNRTTLNNVLQPSKVFFWDQRRDLAREFLEPHLNEPILEIGSTSWVDWIEGNDLLVKDLTCINVSEVELSAGEEEATRSKNKPKFRLMDAQKLDFPDESFSAVYGCAILHHLDLEKALPEITRVLRPNGAIYFAEPLDMNPVGRIVRWMTPGARTVDERPFRGRDFQLMEKHFDCEYTFEALISVPIGVVTFFLGLPPKNAITRWAFHADRYLNRIPGIGPLTRYVVIKATPRR